ncbi:MAG TPA: hypothetical protein VGI10_30570 [Polyangiaceae bacterium]|jgi:hypothetical protein
MSVRRFSVPLLALSFVSRARAQDATPVLLEYRAHAGCPDEQAFVRELTARTRLARIADAGEAAERVRVRIDEVPGGSHGQLVVGVGAGASTRDVSAARCEQVVAALALMTALAIDPDALTAVDASAPPAPVTPVTPTAAKEEPHRQPRVEQPARFHVRAGIAFELDTSLSPNPQPSLRPFLGLERERERGAAFGYALRLSAARGESEIARSDGAGEFTLWRGRLEACPLHAPLSAPLWVSACGAFEAGRLSAVGRDVSSAQSLQRPWYAGGGAARLELRPIGTFGLELAGDVLFPFVRDRFFVQSDSTVRRTSAVVAGGALGVSVRFP